MNDNGKELRPKVHPASREMLPDDPLELYGVEVPGDVELMLRMLVEEYARMGWGVDAVMRLARDPFYHSLHSLLRLWGEEGLRERIEQTIRRVGVLRVREVQSAPVQERVDPPATLVQVDLPRSS